MSGLLRKKVDIQSEIQRDFQDFLNKKQEKTQTETPKAEIAEKEMAFDLCES